MLKVETDPVSLSSKSTISGSASQLGRLILVPGLLLILPQNQLGLCLGFGWVILKPIYVMLQEIALK